MSVASRNAAVAAGTSPRVPSHACAAGDQGWANASRASAWRMLAARASSGTRAMGDERRHEVGEAAGHRVHQRHHQRQPPARAPRQEPPDLLARQARALGQGGLRDLPLEHPQPRAQLLRPLGIPRRGARPVERRQGGGDVDADPAAGTQDLAERREPLPGLPLGDDVAAVPEAARHRDLRSLAAHRAEQLPSCTLHGHPPGSEPTLDILDQSLFDVEPPAVAAAPPAA
jgi:hypothetical protein